jgi:hypothetical protein
LGEAAARRSDTRVARESKVCLQMGIEIGGGALGNGLTPKAR